MDDKGDFVIVWQSNQQDGFSTGVYARLYLNKFPRLPQPPMLTCIENTPIVHRTTVEIQSNQLIQIQGEVYYQAGTEIVLNPNFEVQSGAWFIAQIVGRVSCLRSGIILPIKYELDLH